MTLRLVIFDVDGTLVDSQAHILASMRGAFAAHGLPAPSRSATLSIVGLSLPQAMARLLPERPNLIEGLSAAYRDSFADLRQSGDGAANSPLYPGAQVVLDALAGQPETLLAVATGKSRRGLDHLIEVHGWHGLFQSIQVGDHHPSKPHPSMIDTCLAETGVSPQMAVMVGDTSYDMEMARGAHIAGLGVGWGYHAPKELTQAGAVRVLADFAEMPAALEEFWTFA